VFFTELLVANVALSLTMLQRVNIGRGPHC